MKNIQQPCSVHSRLMKTIPKPTMVDELNESSRSGRISNGRVWPFDSAQDQHERVIFPLHFLAQSTPTDIEFLRGNVPLRRPNETIIDDSESFHRAMAPILIVAQVFGLFPMSGIRSQTAMSLSFKVRSYRTLYTFIIIILLTCVAFISIFHMIKTLNPGTFGVNGGIAAATAGAVFYGNSLFGIIIFFWLSPRWVKLQRDWRSMERQLDNNSKRDRPRLRWKFNIITFIVMSFALVEHILSLINNFPSQSISDNTNVTFNEYIRAYAIKSHGFILSTFNYTLSLGLFLFVISKFATFTWNFTDLFIMLVATGLAERYKSLNKEVIGSVTRNRCTIDWLQLREKYAILSTLVKRTDSDISPVILLSFANNLYFICLQLLNGLSPGEGGILSTLYFFGSFAFLVGRTIAVTLLAARIHDQSKNALPALYNCPADCFTNESERLQHQLTTDDVALTGMKFFSITRNFMLAVAGAIVTYEVVLLQFNVAMNK